jgi:formate dehydrogenase subunit delta
MARTETDHLLAMANDIAANLGFQAIAGADAGADAATRIADHIERFWAPRMRRLLLEYAANDGRGLSEVLLKALQKLAQQ